MIGLFDVVELQTDHEGWGAGTRGTVVEAFRDGVMVEIADEEGRTLAILSLPYDSVRALESSRRSSVLPKPASGELAGASR